MTKRLFLTNATYDVSRDQFHADLAIDFGDHSVVCAFLNVGPDDDGGFNDCILSVQNEFAPHPCHHFPITNELHLTALVTMALFNAMTPDDETYLDVLARGDVTVLEA